MTSLELTTRLQRLADSAGVPVSGQQAQQLTTYLELLARWNSRLNLTALELNGFPDAALSKLIGEPLRASRAVPDRVGTWYDFGSGGGSPAIPLKVVRPDSNLWMIESRSRKAAFLREAVRSVGLARTTVVCDRIENISASVAAAADLVTSRGVRLSAGITAVIEAVLRPGGRLLVFGRPSLDSLGLSFEPLNVAAGMGVLAFER